MLAASQLVILALVNIFRQNKKIRKAAMFIAFLMLFFALSLFVSPAFAPKITDEERNKIIPFVLVTVMTAGTVLLTGLISYLPEKTVSETLQPDDVMLRWVTSFKNANRVAPSEYVAPFDDKETPPRPYDVMEGIQSNLGQLIEYYVINKGQAKSSFRASTTSIAVGFLTIIGGIWLSYAGKLSDNSAVYISVIAGVILQFIGAAYFYLYNRSLIQLNFFFNRLALMQDTLLAIRLTDSIPEGDAKHKVLEKLILHHRHPRPRYSPLPS